jgi:redox-sensitive bicupin YhaK (pirin superfamily)
VATQRDRALDVRRGADRPRTGADWLDSRHSFSFGPHYDPDNTHFGLLLAHNEDVIAPGGGYDTHPHRDVEIVTWVLAGELIHQHHIDGVERTARVRPGTVQRMSAGSGVQHSERNDGAAPLHLVQAWVVSAAPGGAPSYAQVDLTAALDGGGLVPVASGRGHPGAVTLNQPDAVLHAARPLPGAVVTLPDAPFVHLFVGRGEVTIGGVMLSAGDAVRLTGGATVASDSYGAELLVWEMHRSVGG